jgi:hypothetical protein
MSDFRTLKQFILEFDQTYVQGAFGLPAEQRTECPDESNVVMNMALFVRLLEYAREESQSDVDLHVVAENVERLLGEGQKCLSMDDYQQIVPAPEKKEETIPEDFADLRRHLKLKILDQLV